MDTEIELTGGNSNRSVVKMGNTVRRSMGDASPTTHRILTFLEKQGFRESPKFLGIDDNNREILSYIEGSCNINETAWESESILMSAANLLKNLHEALSHYKPGPSDTWAYEYPDKNRHEIFCHNDFGLYNVVISGDRCCGVIDFDLAGPGPRLRDVAYAAYWFVPLSQSAEDMKPYALKDIANRSKRLNTFCTIYGVPADKVLLDMISEVLHSMADERLMEKLIGSEQTALLKNDGHLDHWTREALAFDQYRHTIPIFEHTGSANQA